MDIDENLPSHRLSAYLSFTQRYRFFILAAGIAWFIAVLGLGLPFDSESSLRILIGTLMVLMAALHLLLPDLGAWWIGRRGWPAVQFYLLCLILDTALVTTAVPLTGGATSAAFALYYLLAIGNCYAFEGLGLVLANSFIGASYLAILLATGDGPHAPTALNWADILLVRIPLVFFISYFARWLVRRGDRSAAEEQQHYLNTLRGLLSALEARDGYTKQHSGNVGRWGVVAARSLGLSQEQQEVLLHAGELHDIGKIGVADAILNKNGRLTLEEFAAIKAHPVVGGQIMEHLSWFTGDHLAVVRSHHEKWDGTGYPDGLRETQIPHLARLAAICDVFDALTNDRPYREGMPATHALEIIADGAGTHFDPDLSRQFIRLVGELLALLRKELGAADFRSVTWTDRWAHLRAMGPDGDTWVYVQYDGPGWRLLATDGRGSGQIAIGPEEGLPVR